MTLKTYLKSIEMIKMEYDEYDIGASGFIFIYAFIILAVLTGILWLIYLGPVLSAIWVLISIIKPSKESKTGD